MRHMWHGTAWRYFIEQGALAGLDNRRSGFAA